MHSLNLQPLTLRSSPAIRRSGLVNRFDSIPLVEPDCCHVVPTAGPGALRLVCLAVAIPTSATCSMVSLSLLQALGHRLILQRPHSTLGDTFVPFVDQLMQPTFESVPSGSVLLS